MSSHNSPEFAASHEDEEKDLFKEQFKYYKRRNIPPDLTDVIDFRDENENAGIQKVPYTGTTEQNLFLKGLHPPSKWEIFTLTSSPGFFFIKNPFEPQYQKYWVKRCLEDYHCEPNVTNLDVHLDSNQSRENMWDKYVKDPSNNLMTKIRWATLGYHYDWNTKKYYKDRHSPFPEDLSLLSKCIASCVGFPSFTAEASVVNYYHLKSTLGGHVDFSEFDHDAPLISISLGQSAIFLLGGKTKSVKPVAMYLHSGDIVIMSGQARLAYHGVPQILPKTLNIIPDMPYCASASSLQQTQMENVYNVMDSANNVTDSADNVTNSVDNVMDSADNVTDSADNVTDSVDNVRDSADNVMDSAGNVTESAENVTDTADNVRDRTCDVDCGSRSVENSKDSPHSMDTEYPPKEKSRKMGNVMDTSCDVDTSNSEPYSNPRSWSGRGSGKQNIQCTDHEDVEKISWNFDHEECEKINDKIHTDLLHLDWAPFKQWLNTGRINVNVRQVLRLGQDFPDC